MAGRGKDIEIEDVLSSIQRLVSGNEGAGEHPEVAGMRDRLILDAGHRVDVTRPTSAQSDGATDTPETTASAEAPEQAAAPLVLLDSYRVAPLKIEPGGTDGEDLTLRDKIARLSAASERRRAGTGSGTEQSSASAEVAGFEAETLRGLVRDVVRDELRGRLGREATHTIREIVREEIARALGDREPR